MFARIRGAACLLLLSGCTTVPPAPVDDARALRVRADWLRDNRMVSAELFGSGAGIWNDEVAFRVGGDDQIGRAHV